MKKRVADIVVETLLENGIKDCFAVVGGGAMHIDNALAIHPEMKKYFNHHEQACAMAAEGYAKASGRMALVSVTSGPGALNTLNGVEGAFVDNVPMIVIAGHPRWETTVDYTGLNLRYRGVQEYSHIIETVQGMTKYSKMVVDPLSIKCEVQYAIDCAMQGRKGPCWLSIPLDVQGAMVEESELYPVQRVAEPAYDLDYTKLDELNIIIQKARRPVILAGSGIRTSGAVEEFRAWAGKMNIPVVSGALLPDIMFETAKLFYGTSGNVGQRRGNYILQNADLILTIGNSLATKQTGFNQKLFAPQAKIVMIDAGEDEHKKPEMKVDYPVFCDAKIFLKKALKYLDPWRINYEWIEYCDSLSERLGNIDDVYDIDDDRRVPQALLWDMIRERLPQDGILALGNSSGIVGGLQKSVKTESQRVIVNYNCGSMGDDLPEAIGITVATNKPVLCVTGDGSIMMNLQELQTIKHYDLPISVIILSNNGYGAIRQTNKNFFNGQYIGCDSESGVSMPDFEKVILAFGFEYMKCETVDGLKKTLDWIMRPDGQKVLEIHQKIDDPVLPRIVSKINSEGVFETPALHDMMPYVSEELKKELMIAGEIEEK